MSNANTIEKVLVVLEAVTIEHHELKQAQASIKRSGMTSDAIDEICLTLEFALQGLNSMQCDLESTIQLNTASPDYLDDEYIRAIAK